MRLLLTGANGFIGSYFVKQYAHHYDIKKFSFVKDDFEALHVNDIDVIIHLSALVHQMDGACQDEYEKINVSQTLALAQKAKKEGVKHFIFMSTIKVYGEETNSVYTEKSTCNPIDAYGKTKLKAEQALQELVDEKFKVSIIRTPIVYGYGVKANMKNLIELIDATPILPFGSIYNKRSFVYVGNLCAMIECIIEKKMEGIFLASDDSSLSTSELIKLIAHVKKKRLYLLHVKFFEVMLRWIKPSLYSRLFKSLEVDNIETRKRLGFENPYSVEEGMRLMVKGSLKE